jgi:methionyl-tRNA formyltransferase
MTECPAKGSLPARPRLIFMGTPEFALPTLNALLHHGHNVLAVVTQPDRPKGRGKKLAPSPVKELALQHGIEVLQPEKASDALFCERMSEKAPDLIIVVAFGQILRKGLLAIPKWGVVNIHGSLLPAYRGAAPIQGAIMNNEAKTGLTVMRMDEGLDTGPILFQEEVSVSQDETAGQLHDRLAHLAGELMVNSLKRMAESPVEERPQDHARATYTRKIEKEMSLIDWRQTAAKVSALIRALDPRPGAFTTLQGQEIKLFASRIIDEARHDVVAGRFAGHAGGCLVVETGQGVIGVREIQYPGKKRLPAADFLRGFSLPEGTVLGR